MSVTIQIRNGQDYVRANCPELIHREDLNPADEYDARMIQDHGISFIESYPFELNLANANFRDFWVSIGLSSECYGEVSAERLICALNTFKANKLTCKAEVNGNLYLGGRDTEQVTRYYWSAMKIAQEALKRNESVVWS